MTATSNGQTVTGIQATDDLLVNDLVFTKEFIGGPDFLPGDLVTLRFTIDNMASPLDATSIFFSDDILNFLPDVTVVHNLAPC